MQPSTPPHAIHDCPSPSPDPARPWWSGFLTDRGHPGQWIFAESRSQAIDSRAFGPALVHLLSDYRRACARASQRRSGTFAETNRCAPQAKKWTVCLTVSASLGHAGVNFQRGHTLFLLQASSWTHCHDKSRWIGPETTATYFKYFETSHHKSPSVRPSVVAGDTSLFETRAGGRMLIARCRDGEEVVYGDGRGSKCAFGATKMSCYSNSTHFLQ